MIANHRQHLVVGRSPNRVEVRFEQVIDRRDHAHIQILARAHIHNLTGTWVAGIIWYLVWKQRSKNVGVDVSMTYGELPPE